MSESPANFVLPPGEVTLPFGIPTKPAAASTTPFGFLREPPATATSPSALRKRYRGGPVVYPVTYAVPVPETAAARASSEEVDAPQVLWNKRLPDGEKPRNECVP